MRAAANAPMLPATGASAAVMARRRAKLEPPSVVAMTSNATSDAAIAKSAARTARWMSQARGTNEVYGPAVRSADKAYVILHGSAAKTGIPELTRSPQEEPAVGLKS